MSLANLFKMTNSSGVAAGKRESSCSLPFDGERERESEWKKERLFLPLSKGVERNPCSLNPFLFLSLSLKKKSRRCLLQVPRHGRRRGRARGAVAGERRLGLCRNLRRLCRLRAPLAVPGLFKVLRRRRRGPVILFRFLRWIRVCKFYECVFCLRLAEERAEKVEGEVRGAARRRRGKIAKGRKSTVLVLLCSSFHPLLLLLLSLPKTPKTNMATIARSAACTGVARFAAPGENGRNEKMRMGAPEGEFCRNWIALTSFDFRRRTKPIEGSTGPSFDPCGPLPRPLSLVVLRPFETKGSECASSGSKSKRKTHRYRQKKHFSTIPLSSPRRGRAPLVGRRRVVAAAPVAVCRRSSRQQQGRARHARVRHDDGARRCRRQGR
jgi:hypothetical protein